MARSLSGSELGMSLGSAEIDEIVMEKQSSGKCGKDRHGMAGEWVSEIEHLDAGGANGCTVHMDREG